MLTYCILFVALLGTISAQSFSMGNCDPNIQTMSNFDRNKYAGQWFEIKRGYNLAEDSTKCYIITFTPAKDKVFNIESIVTSKNNSIKTTTIDYAYDDDANNGKLIIRPAFISDEQPFWIIDTDYEIYSILYTCANAYRGKLEYVWINSRTKTPNEEYIQKAEEILKKNNIHVKLITEIQDC